MHHLSISLARALARSPLVHVDHLLLRQPQLLQANNITAYSL